MIQRQGKKYSGPDFVLIINRLVNFSEDNLTLILC